MYETQNSIYLLFDQLEGPSLDSKILNDALNDKIYELNDLDLELYEFAKIQFFKRLKFYRIESE